MSEKRFFTKINKNGRNVIIDKDCNTELFDMTLACDVLNRLDLKLKHYNEVNGEQQATIDELEKNFDDIVKWASEIAKRNVVLDEQIGQLQRENEQLKINLNEYGVDFNTFEIFKESIGYNEMIKSSSIKNKKVVR